MKQFLILCFIGLIPSFLLAQDCSKAWMHYDLRLSLQKNTEEKHGLLVPIEKIQIDFLGAPVGVPYNYANASFSPYSDNVQLKEEDNLLLHKEAYQSLQKMRAEAQKEGHTFPLNYTYRSYSKQAELYKKLGAKQAEKPGYSEHHMYTAIDIKGLSTKKFLWLLRHAFDFGWVPSYYFREGDQFMKERWHWRYVGKLAALKFRCAWETEINRSIWKLKK